ncbi:MAG TPA: GNAT family N-acetyltransferase [Fimbriimonas sp.]
MDGLGIDRALGVFAKGFCFTRSYSHPYESVALGPMRLLRDQGNPRTPRAAEVVVNGTPAAEAAGLIRQARLGRHFVCAYASSDGDAKAVKEDWKGQAYRLLGTETLMAVRLDDHLALPQASGVELVDSKVGCEALAKAAGSRQILSCHLGRPDLIRAYVARDGDALVGWVRSVVCDRDGWVSNMYVRPDCRRRGIGSSLLARMLEDDRAQGLEHSILLASAAGTKLYPHLGYETLGRLLVFCPKRR